MAGNGQSDQRESQRVHSLPVNQKRSSSGTTTLPETPWSQIHIDYAGPFEGKMFLLMADPHSKWLEIQMTNSTTSLAMIEALHKSFSTFGLPKTIVSNNATAFTSSEFSEFVKKNGIYHIFTPPYHPASNSLVERAVQTFKEGMR